MAALKHLDSLSGESDLTDPDRLLAVAEYLDSDKANSAALEQFTLGLAKVTGSRIAAVTLVIDDHVLVTGTHGTGDWILKAGSYEADRTPSSAVIRTGRSLVISDLSQDPQYRDCPMAVDDRIRSYVGAPLMTIRRSVIGSVCLLDREPGVYAESHRSILDHLARYAATQLRIGD